MLSKQDMNIKELAQAMHLSSAIMSMHVKKLERAQLIKTTMMPSNGGAQKVCSLIEEQLSINFPTRSSSQLKTYHQAEVSVGHYTELDIYPTCGISTVEKVIGIFDDPRSFWEPDRVDAKILWLGQGYVEYKVPNYLMSNEQPLELEISLELSSEAPYTNDNWPSDIHFHLNGIELGYWTSPGDFGSTKRGKYTPDWWWDDINQYGLLKVLRINKQGTFIDGQQISDVTLDQLHLVQKQWSFRIGVPTDAINVGGLTLFGAGFGNYNQDIVFRLYYDKKNKKSMD